MVDLWTSHIVKGLSSAGLLAYVYDVTAGQYRWAGDFYALTGQEEPATHEHFNFFLEPRHIAARMEVLHDLVNGMVSNIRFEASLRRADGTSIDIEESAELQNGENGSKSIFGFIRLKSAPQERTPDGRARLKTLLRDCLKRRSAADHGYGFLLTIGMDRFTLYNEAFDVAYADEILDQAAQRLHELTGGAGQFVRMGGDVFSILYPSVQQGEMPVFAKRITDGFCNAPLETSRGGLTVGCSIGGAPLSGSAENAGRMVVQAEIALHKAKQRGRSCFVSYDEIAADMRETRDIIKVADDFLRALREDRLRLAFQPIIDMRDGKVSFHECLVRMVDDRGKLLSAAQFMPAVEKMGLSRIVDQFAIKMAVEELTQFSDLNLSVNVSNQTLNDPEWLRSLVAALRDRPSVAKRLIVEITETVAIKNLDSLLKIVKTLKSLGCRVALDDFGAGNTAFLQLKNLQVDIVKIDKGFVRNINEEQSHLFVRTLQALAGGAQIQTVAEGAETMNEAKMLSSDGVDFVQGYVFGFPQVERVWLPKEHMRRRINFHSQKVETSSEPDWHHNMAV